MKKLVLFVVAAVTVSFASCGAKGGNEAEAVDSVVMKTTDEVAATADSVVSEVSEEVAKEVAK